MTPTHSKGNVNTRWLILAAAVLVLAAAGWYLVRYRASAPADSATARLQTQGASDELPAIESDLNATDLGGLDAELSDIDAELAQ